MYCFYINSVEGEVKGRKIGDPEDPFVKLLVKEFMFYLTLNSKGIWMVRPSFFYYVISFFMLEFIIQIAMLFGS